MRYVCAVFHKINLLSFIDKLLDWLVDWLNAALTWWWPYKQQNLTQLAILSCIPYWVLRKLWIFSNYKHDSSHICQMKWMWQLQAYPTSASKTRKKKKCHSCWEICEAQGSRRRSKKVDKGQSAGAIEGHFINSKNRTRFFTTKGFLRIVDGFFLKITGFLSKVYEFSLRVKCPLGVTQKNFWNHAL